MKLVLALLGILTLASSGCIIRGGDADEPRGQPQDICGNWRLAIQRTSDPDQRADLVRRAPPECKLRVAAR